MPIRRVMRLVGRRGKIARLSVLQWRSEEAGISRSPPWSVTFADSRSSTRAFHAVQRMGFDEGLRRARAQEGNTAELHGNGLAVDLDFGDEGRVLHRCYTSNKTRFLLGEHRRVPTGVGSRHHSKDVATVVRWYVW